MNFLYAIFFGAGIAGFAYTKIGNRVGYGNSQNVWSIVGVAFVLSTAVFYLFLAVILGIN